MNWQTFTIVINGEITKIKAVSAEMAVSSLMCWYSYNTLFIVFDEGGNVSTFKNIAGNNIEGTKLIKINAISFAMNDRLSYGLSYGFC